MTTAQIKRRMPRRWAIVGAIVATMLVGGTALAVHDATGPMELDGNIIDGAGGGTDWQAIFDASGNQTAGVPAGTLDTTGVIRDFVPGATGPDVSYHEPSNKDDQAIGPTGATWGCVSAANPTDKTDIVNAYGMAVQGDAATGDGDTADDQLFYFGVERFDNSGDAFIGLWLFQDDVSCTADGKFVGSKRTGDILVLSNFTGGGSTATIQLFRYTAGTGTNPGTFADLVTVTGKCENVNTGDLPFPQNDICATINDTNSFVTPWAMEDKIKPGPPSPDPVREIDPDQFVEGGVNITDIFAGAGLGAPPCFGSFLAETRSSSSLDATLKDYALGDLQFCDISVVTTPSATTRVLGSADPITDTADVSGTSPGGNAPTPTGTMSFFLCGPNVTGCADGQGAPIPSAPAAAVTLGACNPVVAGHACATSADASGLITGTGTYCFRAVYDPGNDPFYGAKGGSFDGPNECFTVTDVSEIVTNQDWLPNDSATVTTGGSAVSGTVVFSLYENGTCTGDPVATFTDSTPADGFTTDNDDVYTSDQTVSWSATYTSDNGVGGSTSNCEVSSVTIDNNH